MPPISIPTGISISATVRQRGITLGDQGPDKMSKLTAWVDPELRGYLEAIEAKLAPRRMCNPDDDTPTAPDTYNDVEISVADTAARLKLQRRRRLRLDQDRQTRRLPRGRPLALPPLGRWLCLPSAAGSASPRPSAFSLNIAPA